MKRIALLIMAVLVLVVFAISPFASAASITLSPDNGVTATTISGVGFEENSIITIRWNGIIVPTIPRIVKADNENKFVAIISVYNQMAGIYTIRADNGTDNASENFTVNIIQGVALDNNENRLSALENQYHDVIALVYELEDAGFLTENDRLNIMNAVYIEFQSYISTDGFRAFVDAIENKITEQDTSIDALEFAVAEQGGISTTTIFVIAAVVTPVILLLLIVVVMQFRKKPKQLRQISAEKLTFPVKSAASLAFEKPKDYEEAKAVEAAEKAAEVAKSEAAKAS